MKKYIVITTILLNFSVFGQFSLGGLNTSMGIMGGLQSMGGYRSPQSYTQNNFQRPNLFQQSNSGGGYQTQIRPAPTSGRIGSPNYWRSNQYQRPNTGYQRPNTGYQQPNQYQRPNMGYQRSNNGYQQSNFGTNVGGLPQSNGLTQTNSVPLHTQRFTLNNGYLLGQSKFYYYDPKSKKYVPWVRKNLR